MKTIRRRRSRQPAMARHDDTALHHITEIRRELAHVSMTLQERLNCFNQNIARYLSEAEAANYEPASPHIANAADVIRFCETHFKDLLYVLNDEGDINYMENRMPGAKQAVKLISQ